MFNLVYETNVASCRIWDALGFKRIGRVKGCGNLKSYPDQLIDAIIYGRDLGADSEDFITEERFQRIKFYLKNGRYPDGADRSEKSRLRSAASHYRLLPATEIEPEKLMLKGKEVISDPQLQYETTRKIHVETHGGINKTTAAVAEKYHWIRIKETASQVIKNCALCLAASAPSARNVVPLPERRGPGGTWTLGHFYPFDRDREYSVPPGEPWLRSYGQLKDQGPQTPAAPPPELTELPSMEADADADADVEADADSYALREIENANRAFDGGNIPVDPALMEGLDALDEARLFLDSQADAQLQAEAAQAARDAVHLTDAFPAMKPPPKRPGRPRKRQAAEMNEDETEAPYSAERFVSSKRDVSTASEAPSVGQSATPLNSKEKSKNAVPEPDTETSTGSGSAVKRGRGRPRKSDKVD